MKLEVGPVHSTYVAPTFDDRPEHALDPRLARRLRRPMLIGGAVIAVLVFGLGTWAALTPLASGISAVGEVGVESNLQTINHKETAKIRAILVKDGQLVHAGQPLITFDDTDLKAEVTILQNQVDSLEAEAARLTAESTNRPGVTFPADLTSRASDPQVAGLIRDQQLLFLTRQQLYQSQLSVLQQRLEQNQNQIVGDQAQVAAQEEQRKYTAEEMGGYETLYAKGFAPKTMILREKTQLADIEGRKGALMADIARVRQQIGEVKMQMASVTDQRTSQGAEQLRDSESKLEEALPKLIALRAALADTVATAPVDGYVFNLTQFTPGGVVGTGQALMQIVPVNSPLIINVLIKPQDIDQVHVGMDARVRLIGPNPRWIKPVVGKVTFVSADRITNDKTGESFFKANVRIDPKDMQELEKHVKVVPGMNAVAQIVTGKRTLMGFLIQPITDTLSHAFREQ